MIKSLLKWITEPANPRIKRIRSRGSIGVNDIPRDMWGQRPPPPKPTRK